MVDVAGKPARLLSALHAAPDLHFLPVPMTPALLDACPALRPQPRSLSRADPCRHQGETIAVGAVMAMHAWPANTGRYKHVARFLGDVFDKAITL